MEKPEIKKLNICDSWDCGYSKAVDDYDKFFKEYKKRLASFLIDNRQIWNSKEWDLIRMKWFELEERYTKKIRR